MKALEGLEVANWHGLTALRICLVVLRKVKVHALRGRVENCIYDWALPCLERGLPP